MIAPIEVYDGASQVRIVILYQVDFSIRQIMLLGEQPKCMQKVAVRDYLLLVVIQQIDHASDRLTSLIRPARTVPLTAAFTFVIEKLFEIVWIGRLLRSISKFAEELRGVNQMFPG